MFKRRKSRFSESELSRQKPRRKLFRALLTGKPSRHHAHAVAHDDNRRISLSIKVILLLLVLHIVALAATGLHSQFTDNQEPATQVGNEAATPPPVREALVSQTQAPQIDVAPQVQAPAPAPAPTFKEATQPSTQVVTSLSEAVSVLPTDSANPEAPSPPVSGMDDLVVMGVAEDPDEDTQPAPAPANVAKIHHVKAGDSWLSLSKKYKVSQGALRAANPRLAELIGLSAGLKVNIPRANQSATASTRPAASATGGEKAYHTVVDGETLSGIARKHKLTLTKLIKLNGFTQKQANRISIGQKIRVK